jgi:hypothetical protein
VKYPEDNLSSITLVKEYNFTGYYNKIV